MSEKITSIRFALVSMLLFFCAAIQAQTISGNVKDKSGEPIIGATVMEQGVSGNGTVTDFDGNFTLKLKGKENKLAFSYVGMQNKIVDVKGKTSVNVMMQDDAQMLEEVVAIGYTTVRKKDLTGAVAQVSSKQIEDVPVSNVTEALTGKMAGVNITTTEGSPDADVTIRVRGGGSISQDNSPLYIVDGFEVSSISDIAPSDIATIDVLKDAASTAIYGARGANGVIIITTKTGKEGTPVQINFNASYGWEKVIKEIPVMDPYNYGLYQYEYTSNKQFLTDKSNYGAYSELEQLKGMKGTDYQDLLFGNTGHRWTTDVSVSGGTKALKYNASYAHVTNDAILLNSGYKRDNAMGRLQPKFNKWLSADFKVTIANTKVDGLGSGADTNESSATTSYSNSAIGYAPIEAFSGSEDDDEDNAFSTRVNPYERVTGTYKMVATFKHAYNAGITWQPWKGWKFNTRFSYEGQNQNSEQAWLAKANTSSRYDNAGLGLVVLGTTKKNTFIGNTTATYNGKKLFSDNDNLTAIIGHEWRSQSSKTTEDVYTGFPSEYNTFDKMLNNIHSYDVTPMDPYSYTAPDDRLNSFFGQVLYTYNDRYYLNATLRADGSSKFGSGNQWGVFPAVQVAWRISEENFMKSAKWISNLKIRLSIGSAGNNRINSGLIATQYQRSDNDDAAAYFTNPVTSEEERTAYIQHSQYLYNPKLKWETTITRNFGIDYGFWNGRVNGSIDLYWNSTNDLLMKARVQSSSGYLYQYQNFGSTENKGFEFSTNVVCIDTKKFSLNGNFNISYNQNKITKLNSDDPWQSSRFATSSIDEYNEFYVTEGGRLGEIWGFQYDGYYTADELKLDANGNWTTKDGNNYTYSNGTIYPGAPKYKDVSGANGVPDGQIDTNDKVRLGNTVPTWTGGFGFDASWKNDWGTIDASVFCNFSLGNKILNGTKLVNSYFDQKQGYNLIADFNMDNRYAWVDPTTGLNLGRPNASTILAYGGGNAEAGEAAIIQRLNEINAGKSLWCPTAVSSMVISDWALEDASFLKLQSVTIGYTFPKSILKKLHLQKIRVYFTGHNLACWTKYTGYDPEVSVSKNGMCPGIDFATYPRSRSYTMGINVSF